MTHNYLFNGEEKVLDSLKVFPEEYDGYSDFVTVFDEFSRPSSKHKRHDFANGWNCFKKKTVTCFDIESVKDKLPPLFDCTTKEYWGEENYKEFWHSSTVEDSFVDFRYQWDDFSDTVFSSKEKINGLKVKDWPLDLILNQMKTFYFEPIYGVVGDKVLLINAKIPAFNEEGARHILAKRFYQGCSLSDCIWGEHDEEYYDLESFDLGLEKGQSETEFFKIYENYFRLNGEAGGLRFTKLPDLNTIKISKVEPTKESDFFQPPFCRKLETVFFIPNADGTLHIAEHPDLAGRYNFEDYFYTSVSISKTLLRGFVKCFAEELNLIPTRINYTTRYTSFPRKFEYKYDNLILYTYLNKQERIDCIKSMLSFFNKETSLKKDDLDKELENCPACYSEKDFAQNLFLRLPLVGVSSLKDFYLLFGSKDIALKDSLFMKFLESKRNYFVSESRDEGWWLARQFDNFNRARHQSSKLNDLDWDYEKFGRDKLLSNGYYKKHIPNPSTLGVYRRIYPTGFDGLVQKDNTSEIPNSLIHYNKDEDDFIDRLFSTEDNLIRTEDDYYAYLKIGCELERFVKLSKSDRRYVLDKAYYGKISCYSFISYLARLNKKTLKDFLKMDILAWYYQRNNFRLNGGVINPAIRGLSKKEEKKYKKNPNTLELHYNLFYNVYDHREKYKSQNFTIISPRNPGQTFVLRQDNEGFLSFEVKSITDYVYILYGEKGLFPVYYCI